MPSKKDYTDFIKNMRAETKSCEGLSKLKVAELRRLALTMGFVDTMAAPKVRKPRKVKTVVHMGVEVPRAPRKPRVRMIGPRNAPKPRVRMIGPRNAPKPRAPRAPRVAGTPRAPRAPRAPRVAGAPRAPRKAPSAATQQKYLDALNSSGYVRDNLLFNPFTQKNMKSTPSNIKKLYYTVNRAAKAMIRNLNSGL